MSPAPTSANLYFAIYKAIHILPLLNSFLFYLKRFIEELAAFYHRLLDRGYKAANIIPLLIKGIDNANYYLSLTKAQREKAKKALMGRADE
jgi:hypothetical protein